MKIRSSKFAAPAAAAALSLAVVSAAQPAQAFLVAGSSACDFFTGCTLADIIAGGGLKVDSILFESFTVQAPAIPNPLTTISVLPYSNTSGLGQTGLGISAPLFATSAGGSPQIENMTLKYKATGMDGVLINGIGATLDGATAIGTGTVSLAENAFSDAARTNNIGSLLLGAGVTLAPDSGSVPFASPVMMTWLTKDLLAKSGENGEAHVSSFVNYHEEIPTPALLPGLLGFGATILRKRKQGAESVAA